MSDVALAEGKKRLYPGTVFRKDYRKHVLISYLEAADYMGVTVKTIQKWIWQGNIPLASKVGPFRIDITELDRLRKRGLK